MLELKLTSSFKKDLKRISKRNKDTNKISEVVAKLLNKETLEEKYKDHQLINYGNNKNTRECHIEPDWLLVYCIDNDNLILLLIRTGSHSDLF